MTVRQWCADPSDFLKGLDLFDKYGTLPNLKRVLRAQGPTEYAREKLHYELSKFIGVDDHLQEAESVIVSPVPVVDIPETVSDPVIFHDEPPVTDEYLVKLDKERVECFLEMSGKHAMLTYQGDLMTEEERKQFCQRIRELDDINKEFWAKRDRYLQGGIKEVEHPESFSLPEDPVQLLNMRNTNRAYISKCNKRISEGKVKNTAKMEAELKRREAENIEIQKRLDEKSQTSDQAL